MSLCLWVFSFAASHLLTAPPPHAPPCEAGVGGGGGGGQPFVSNLVAACRTPGSVHFQDNPLLLLQIASVRLSQPHL